MRRVRQAVIHVAGAAVLLVHAAGAQVSSASNAYAKVAGNCMRHDASTRPDCPAAIEFLSTFQKALAQDDRARVASLVSYPLRVPPIAGQHLIRSRAELLARYNLVFTPAVRAKVLAAKPEDVWGNQLGFMIAQGVIWFDDRGVKPGSPSAFRLIAVNPANP